MKKVQDTLESIQISSYQWQPCPSLFRAQDLFPRIKSYTDKLATIRWPDKVKTLVIALTSKNVLSGQHPISGIRFPIGAQGIRPVIESEFC